MSQMHVSIDPVDLVRGPSFLVGGTIQPSGSHVISQILEDSLMCVRS